MTTVTADKHLATIITPEMVEAGMHFNAVGGDGPGKTELDPGVLQRASVFVEYPPQTRVEGDIQRMPADFPVTELWTVLAGQHPGRRDAREVTMFDSVGFALEDFSALCYLQSAAAQWKLGDTLDLIPQLGDPKNLAGLLGRGAGMPEPVKDRKSAPYSQALAEIKVANQRPSRKVRNSMAL